MRVSQSDVEGRDCRSQYMLCSSVDDPIHSWGVHDCTWLDWASFSCATFGSDDDGDYSCDGDSREKMMKNILRIMTVMSTVTVILTTMIMIMTMAMITLKASSTGSQSSKLNPISVTVSRSRL